MNKNQATGDTTEKADSQTMDCIAKPALLIDCADDLFTRDIMGPDVRCYETTEALLYWEHSLPEMPTSFSGIGNLLPNRDAIWIEWADAPFARSGVWVRTGSIPIAEQQHAISNGYILSALYRMLDDVRMVAQYVSFRKHVAKVATPTNYLVLNTWDLDLKHERPTAVPTASYALYLDNTGAMIDAVIYAIDALQETSLDVISVTLTKALISLNALNRFHIVHLPTHVTERGFQVRPVQIKSKGFVQ